MTDLRRHVPRIALDWDDAAPGASWQNVDATLVFADAAGQEHSVEKSQISDNSETHLSLMPAVFGESIPEADFYHLLAYLLEHSAGAGR